MENRLALVALAVAVLGSTGCVRGNQEFQLGRRAELLQDYDTALVHYKNALQADPSNVEYKLRVERMRFEAAQAHVEQGQKLLAAGNLEAALGQFQRALAIDPASAIADQLSRETAARIAAREHPPQPPPPAEELPAGPPRLKPLSRERINLKLTNDVRVVYETVAKLAGLTVLFDPDLTSRRISVELPNVTLEEALDAVALESKTFWKPVTSNIIFVAPDQPQKRRDYEDEQVRTFYLANTLTPQDLTEITGGLRTLLQVRNIQQINPLHAIVIRDTPDKLAVAEKILRDVDKARPEVVVQVSVLEVDMNRLRQLGITPGTSTTVTFTPRSALQPSSGATGGTTATTGGTTTTGTPQITLNNLQRLSTADYSITLPGAAAQALLTDSTTKVVQNPEVRITDGETARVRIGERFPVAMAAYQGGVGVGVGAAGTSIINPLLNTSFQYQDVGVNLDVTPRVHPDGEVSLKLSVEVSSVATFQNIGGINQPVFNTRKIEHEIRLRNGEVNVLGGLIKHSTTKSVSGFPGLARIPFLRYFFSGEQVQSEDQELLIVLTPRIVRMPNITPDNLRPLYTGTETNIEVLPRIEPGAGPATALGGAAASAGATAQAAPVPPAATGPRLRFVPETLTLQPGQTATLALTVENVTGLAAVPLILHYDPAVIAVEDVRDGGFLSGGTQTVAIVHHEDPRRGEAVVSILRPPNTGGVNGSGTLLGIVIRGVAPGMARLRIAQVDARDAQQKPLALGTGEAIVRVGPQP
jgi:general secretion pathway protein D